MLENIRNIGIFMIAAQAVVHFSPGKQYEKYIKSVAGIVILLLFLKPFLQLSGGVWEEPEAVLEKLPQLTDMPAFPGEEGAEEVAPGKTNADVGSTVINGMETEVEALLNRELEGEDYRVRQVSLRFAEDPLQAGGVVLSEVEVTMVQADAAEGEKRIGIDEIVVGDGTDPSKPDVFSAYRKQFAAFFGIEETRVEVRQDGRG